MSGPGHAAVALAYDPVLPRRDDLLDEDLVAARLDESAAAPGSPGHPSLHTGPRQVPERCEPAGHLPRHDRTAVGW